MITAAKADQCLRQLKKDYAWYLDGEPEVNYPSVVEHDGSLMLTWESGPDEWAYEYCLRLNKVVNGIEACPYYSFSLSIHPNN